MELQVILDIAIVALRVLMPVYAIVIVYQCYASMRRKRRDEKPLVTLFNNRTADKIPVLYWENSIGRGRGCDITINDPTVSRDHCVLLRREEGWFVADTDSKGGTFVNGEQIEDRTKVYIEDKIRIGSSEFTLLRGDCYDEELLPSRYFEKAKEKPVIKQYKLMLLITLFHLFMAVQAAFSFEVQDFQPFMVFGVLAGIEWGFFFISTVLFKRVNFELEALGLFLSGTGIMLLVRQVVHQAFVQMIAMTGGIILFMIMIKFLQNPDIVIKLRTPMMIAALLLIAVNIVFGKTQNGAQNWITIGSISIQPSELVKIAYIFVGAGTLDKTQTKRDLFVFIVLSAVCVLALAWMGDFGTALIFFATFLILSFTRSGDFKTLILALSGAVFGGAIVLKFKSYVAKRFESWGHVWEYAQSDAYQQARVLTYIASGGLFGVGIGNGCLKYVFASESDLVFGIIAEEMGIIIAVTIAAAIAALVFYARAISTRSRSTFYSISACCAAGLLVIQMSLNIFGATDILPLTGVTLPFISLGGSSMISCWGLLAFIKAADERTYAIKRR